MSVATQLSLEMSNHLRGDVILVLQLLVMTFNLDGSAGAKESRYCFEDSKFFSEFR